MFAWGLSHDQHHQRAGLAQCEALDLELTAWLASHETVAWVLNLVWSHKTAWLGRHVALPAICSAPHRGDTKAEGDLPRS